MLKKFSEMYRFDARYCWSSCWWLEGGRGRRGGITFRVQSQAVLKGKRQMKEKGLDWIPDKQKTKTGCHYAGLEMAVVSGLWKPTQPTYAWQFSPCQHSMLNTTDKKAMPLVGEPGRRKRHRSHAAGKYTTAINFHLLLRIFSVSMIVPRPSCSPRRPAAPISTAVTLLAWLSSPCVRGTGLLRRTPSLPGPPGCENPAAPSIAGVVCHVPSALCSIV